MCGICGIVSKHDHVERETIERMSETTVPPAAGSNEVVIDGTARFAAGRLAIHRRRLEA
jgi:asparagine synthetase B (glutamine-hydrolysing)